MKKKELTEKEFNEGIKQLAKKASQVYGVEEKEVQEFINRKNEMIDSWREIRETKYNERAEIISDSVQVYFSRALIDKKKKECIDDDWENTE